MMKKKKMTKMGQQQVQRKLCCTKSDLEDAEDV